MAKSLKVCLFDVVCSDDDPFGAPFQQVEGLDVVGECSTWQELQVFLSGGHVDAVIVNLDQNDVRADSQIFRHIVEVMPQCGIIGVSRNADPDTIIATMRAGCHQYVRWPVDPVDLRAALDQVHQARSVVTSHCGTFAVIGSSGGAGATTVACNLAIELAHLTEKECALVDMDLQYGDVACAFDVKPRFTLADVCHTDMEIDRTALESALTKLPCNVSLLARPEHVDKAEEVSAEVVSQMFGILSQLFPFAVVDVPRYFSPAVHAALGSVGRVLIVTQLTVPQLRHATRIYEALIGFGTGEEKIEIVLNRCNAHYERIKPTEVEQHFGRPIFAVIPNDYKNIGVSRDRGHPLMADSSNSPARLAISDLARSLAGEHMSEERLRSPERGLFGRFRKRRSALATP